MLHTIKNCVCVAMLSLFLNNPLSAELVQLNFAGVLTFERPEVRGGPSPFDNGDLFAGSLVLDTLAPDLEPSNDYERYLFHGFRLDVGGVTFEETTLNQVYVNFTRRIFGVPLEFIPQASRGLITSTNTAIVTSDIRIPFGTSFVDIPPGAPEHPTVLEALGIIGRPGGVFAIQDLQSNPGYSHIGEITSLWLSSGSSPLLPDNRASDPNRDPADLNSVIDPNFPGLRILEPWRWEFFDQPSRAWYDPPTTEGFLYEMTDSSLFTEILNFPTGFDALFDVWAEGALLGSFSAGDSVDFVTELGHGVSKFAILGIEPHVDSADPNAFPLQLAFDATSASFTMQGITSVPEPTTLVLTIFGLFAFNVHRNQNLRV